MVNLRGTEEALEVQGDGALFFGCQRSWFSSSFEISTL